MGQEEHPRVYYLILQREINQAWGETELQQTPAVPVVGTCLKPGSLVSYFRSLHHILPAISLPNVLATEILLGERP